MTSVMGKELSVQFIFVPNSSNGTVKWCKGARRVASVGRLDATHEFKHPEGAQSQAVEISHEKKQLRDVTTLDVISHASLLLRRGMVLSLLQHKSCFLTNGSFLSGVCQSTV